MAVQVASKAAVGAGQGSIRARLQEAEHPVVIDVWAPWCGPCRAMAPHLAAVSSEYVGRIDVWKINADEQPEVVRELGIMGIPTLIVFRNGREATRYVGGMGATGIRALFATALAEETDAPHAPQGVDATERRLRLGVAAVLLGLAAFTGWPPVLLLAAAAVFFSAIHDRCPLWQGIKTRLGW